VILAGFMLAAGVAAPTSSAWAGTEFHPQRASHVHRLSSGGTLGAASDQTQDFCSNLGAGYCMNDWGGNHNQGAPIKMYYGNSTNEQFEVQPLNKCNSTPIMNQVTETCPFTLGSGLNAKYAGSLIFQLYYPDANKCIGTSSGGNGILTACNDASGNGGGDGTILIAPGGATNPIIDRYWTDVPPASEAYLCGTGLGGPLQMGNISFSTACEWER
jgi:hypothetical protein